MLQHEDFFPKAKEDAIRSAFFFTMTKIKPLESAGGFFAALY